MPSPIDLSEPTPRRPWYATDSGRVGVALTLVTLLVLAVGIAVIHSASRSSATASTEPEDGLPVTPVEPPVREPMIVLEGSRPTPSPLPSPQEQRIETAERIEPTLPGRL